MTSALRSIYAVLFMGCLVAGGPVQNGTSNAGTTTDNPTTFRPVTPRIVVGTVPSGQIISPLNDTSRADPRSNPQNSDQPQRREAPPTLPFGVGGGFNPMGGGNFMGDMQRMPNQGFPTMMNPNFIPNFQQTPPPFQQPLQFMPQPMPQPMQPMQQPMQNPQMQPIIQRRETEPLPVNATGPKNNTDIKRSADGSTTTTTTRSPFREAPLGNDRIHPDGSSLLKDTTGKTVAVPMIPVPQMNTMVPMSSMFPMPPMFSFWNPYGFPFMMQMPFSQALMDSFPPNAFKPRDTSSQVDQSNRGQMIPQLPIQGPPPPPLNGQQMMGMNSNTFRPN